MSIVVTTPTGHVGRRVVERLLEARADVTLLARDATRLPADVAGGRGDDDGHGFSL